MLEIVQRVALYFSLPAGLEPQQEEHQLTLLRSECTRRRWSVVHEYIDLHRSSTEERDLLLADAQVGRFDVVLCSSIEDFASGSVRQAIDILGRLQASGVGFHSLAEPSVSTLDGQHASWPAALAVLARLEPQERSNQIRAGLRNARQVGARGGRPRISLQTRREILRLRQEKGLSIRQIARQLGVSRGTVSKYQAQPVDDLFEVLRGR